jgi:hypothetical protein
MRRGFTPEDVIALGRLPVYFDVALRRVLGIDGIVDEIIGKSRQVWQWKQSLHFLSDRVHAAHRDGVTGEWLASLRVVYYVLACFGEHSLPLQSSRHCENVGLSLVRNQLLVVDEEEQLVLDDGAAEKTAKLIRLIGSSRLREEIPRIQIVIPQEIEDLAMKLVSAGFNSKIDDCASEGAVLGIRVAGFHLERLDGVERRRDADEGVERLGIVNPVNHVVVAGPGKAVYDCLRGRQSSGRGRVFGEVAPSSLDGPGNDGHELLEETPVQRQRLNLMRFDVLTQIGSGALD